MRKLKLALLALCVLWIATLLTVTGDREVRAQSEPKQKKLEKIPEIRERGREVYLEQGWSTAERRMFYHTTQGTRLIPYKWFLALESRPSQQSVLADETVLRYNLLPDPDTTDNPDRLPIGLVKDVSPDGEFIGVTCAACHTGQINFNGTTILIDGGSSMNNLNGFFEEVFDAIGRTLVNSPGFERFAQRVLGERNSVFERSRLKLQLTRTLISSADLGLKASLKGVYPTEEGFGRLDALGRSSNLVLATAIGDQRNLVTANSPVAYPHLWGTHSFDWSLWNGSMQQPMARNVWKALGLNAPVTLKGDAADLFQSTVNVRNLASLEKLLERLTPPRWPEEVLGQIDPDKASRGELLYAKHCAACHESQPAPPNEFGKVFLQIKTYPISEIGTDPTAAYNFNKRVVYTGQLSQNSIGLDKIVPAAAALQGISANVIRRQYDELQIAPDKQPEMNGFRRNVMRAPLAYRARNMDGIWATPPYLHNNSVPNLYQLLLPADKRDKVFYVGNLEYDARHVGFKTNATSGSFQFDTKITGNSNAGHEFSDMPSDKSAVITDLILGKKGGRISLGQSKGVIGPLLTDDERWAIIEYLKTR